ncbi:MAG: protein DA1 [Candidatus Sericytochromatia bacterium]
MVTAPTICTRCGKRLGPQVIRAGKAQYHPACFCCDHCKKPLEQSFVPRAQRLYHPACHDLLFVPRCSDCGQAIQGTYSHDAAGRYHPECYTRLHHLICSLCQQTLQGAYLLDHWGNKAHPEHQGVATGLCHVCARLMPAADSAAGRRLADGRLLCGGCHVSEIADFRQIQQAKLDVIAQMQAVGFAYIPDYIKVELSGDQQLLNERLRASPTGNIHGFTRTARRMIPGYGEILEHSISVLSGLPRVAFMGVLAHELLHVWIHEQNLDQLDHAQVEGFCNLGTALILKNALAGPDTALAGVLLQRMDEDPDPAYGDGYRAMEWRLGQLGWPGLLAALQQRAALADPEPELIRPKQKVETSPEPVPAKAPAAPTATSAAAERLQALKQKLQQAAAPQSGAPQSAPKPAASRPDVSPEVADKVRERFARPVSPPKPPPKASDGKGGKLGKLKKRI